MSTNSKGGVLGQQRWLSFITGPRNFLSDFFEGWVKSGKLVLPVWKVGYDLKKEFLVLVLGS